MNKQRALIIASFVMIGGIVVLYVFLGATEIAQNDVDESISDAANVSALVEAPTAQSVQGRALVSEISDTFPARQEMDVQSMIVTGENQVVFLERGSKKVVFYDFRDQIDERELYDLSSTVTGNIEFAILPKRSYEDFIFLKVDGRYWVYYVDAQELQALPLETSFVTYNELTQDLYAVENGETSDSRVVRYEVVRGFQGGYALNPSELFAYGGIDRVYTSFNSVFVTVSNGLYRYYDDRLFRVFESTAAPRASFSPLSNYAIVNDSEGNSFLYEFTDEEDLIFDLGESYVPSRILWGSSENIFEIQTGLLRELQFGLFLEQDGFGAYREWPLSEEYVIQPFLFGLDGRDGIYFVDAESNTLQYMSRLSRFE
jgi:uncharacterized membrane protein